jgi:hypothetical protein
VTSGQEPAGKGVPFDTSRPHMARVYDFWLGGTDNFAADRAVAGQVAAAYPDVLIAVQAQRGGGSWLLGILQGIPGGGAG